MRLRDVVPVSGLSAIGLIEEAKQIGLFIMYRKYIFLSVGSVYRERGGRWEIFTTGVVGH